MLNVVKLLGIDCCFQRPKELTVTAHLVKCPYETVLTQHPPGKEDYTRPLPLSSGPTWSGL